MKIYDQKNGALSPQDRLQLATLLIKAGFYVRIGKEKSPGKTTNINFIEYDGIKQDVSES